MELSDEVILFKENLDYIEILKLKVFNLSMLLSYNSKGNLAQFQRESKKIGCQMHHIKASSVMQKCLVMFRTNDYWSC